MNERVRNFWQEDPAKAAFFVDRREWYQENARPVWSDFMTGQQAADLKAFREGWEGDGHWWDSDDLDSELLDVHMQRRDAWREWNEQKPTWTDDWRGDVGALDFDGAWFTEARALWKAEQERLSYLSDRRAWNLANPKYENYMQ